MKRIVEITIAFVTGIFIMLAIGSVIDIEPYDLAIYHGTSYEIWVRNQLSSPLPMAKYTYTVLYRDICTESKNICSEWKKVGEVNLDNPSRASDIHFSENASDIIIELPEGIVIQRKGGKWNTLLTHL